MKKIVVIVVVLGGLGGGGYYWLWGKKAVDPAQQTVTAPVERGQLRVTVSSTGRVVSNLDVEIKCKASGEVIELPFDVSDSVKEGQLLLRLDPNDELRKVRQAEVVLQSSQAKLRVAEQNLAIATLNLATDTLRAKAALETAKVRAHDARTRADRLKELLARKLASQDEQDSAEALASLAEAEQKYATIRMEELKTQEQAIELKRQEKRQAEAQAESDQIDLDIARQRLRDTTVNAPMDGVVTARPVQIGQIVSSGISNVGGGTTVLMVSDLSRIFVIAAVDESDIGKVEVGQPASITVDAFPGQFFDGNVVRIAAKGNNISNVVTYEVKIEVFGSSGSGGVTKDALIRKAVSRPAATVPGGDTAPSAGQAGGPRSPDGRRTGKDGPRPLTRPARHLKPEMTANVEIVVTEKKDVLLAPADAVFKRDQQYLATVSKPDGGTEDRTVEIGMTNGTKTEIVNGLSEGDVVVRKNTGDSKWRGGSPRMTPGRMMGGR